MGAAKKIRNERSTTLFNGVVDRVRLVWLPDRETVKDAEIYGFHV